MESTGSSPLAPVDLLLPVFFFFPFKLRFITFKTIDSGLRPFIWVTPILQDTVVIKTPKRSPLLLTMVVVVFAMVCGVYVCSIFLKQTSNSTKAKPMKFQVIDQPCPLGTEPWEIPYVHYPKPETHSR